MPAGLRGRALGAAETLGGFFFVFFGRCFLRFLVDGWCVIKAEVLCGVQFSDGVLLAASVVASVSPFVLDSRYRKQDFRKPGYADWLSDDLVVNWFGIQASRRFPFLRDFLQN